MAKYINADELKDNITAQFGTRYEMSCFDIVSTIMDMPPADVVEVVRCKDCKFATVHYGDLVCRKEKPCLFRELEDYCSYGERRETE